MTTIVIDVLANEVDAARRFYNDVGFIGVHGQW
jgi:hypothetical protein